MKTTLCGESSHHRPSNTRMRPPPSGFVQVGLSPAIGRSLPTRLSVPVSPGSQMLPRRFRICPDVEDSSLRSRDHPPRTQRRDNTHSIAEMRRAITNSFGASAQG